MKLTCYLHEGWKPLIRPAEATREWMTSTPESFAYRCLPLSIANAHGWEILSAGACDACWTGGTNTANVAIRLPPGSDAHMAPVSIFGQGVLTFHIFGIFRTPPGWNLWVGGSPNRPKDGIYPLTGIVETDWAPFTFTMNWRFTRPNHWVHFDAQEPICFVFPVERAVLEEVTPEYVPMEAAPELLNQFTAWSRSRDEHRARMEREPPQAPAEKWQKHYYRGIDMAERTPIADHRTKLRLAPFKPGTGAGPEGARASSPMPQARTAHPAKPAEDVATAGHGGDAALAGGGLALRKRDWLLDAMERQQELAPAAVAIERRVGLSREEFLVRYYAAGRPVILVGEMSAWPALSRWTPGYLQKRIGAAPIEYQGERSKDERFEMYKDAHRRELPFDRFIDLISAAPGNDAYMTAYNSARNAAALAPLAADLGFLEKFLAREAAAPHGMMWIGPAGTVTSLHHDLTNNLIAQVVGRKRMKIIPAADVGKLYNHRHVFSEIADLEAAALEPGRFPLLAGARVYDVTLAPGEIIFIPLAWWHQVQALDFSVTITYTNFLWPNDGSRGYPEG